MSEVKEKAEIIEALNWRYAVKKFKSDKLPDEKVDTLLEAIRLSASSYGQMPYRVIHVKDQEIRDKLVSASFNQEKVANASELFVFAITTKIDEETVDDYVDLAAKTWDEPKENIKDYAGMIKKTYNSLSQEEKEVWATNQAYIALGNLLISAALEQVDACPMEGFDNEKYDEILGLNEKGLKAKVLTTLGYRHEDDQLQYKDKVRIPTEKLVMEI